MSWLADLIVLAGLAAFGYGLHLVYPPAAPIGVGALLMLFGLLLARRIRRAD